MFETGHDAANRATVAALGAEAIPPAGFAVVGPRREVDKAVDKLRMHP